MRNFYLPGKPKDLGAVADGWPKIPAADVAAGAVGRLNAIAEFETLGAPKTL